MRALRVVPVWTLFLSITLLLLPGSRPFVQAGPPLPTRVVHLDAHTSAAGVRLATFYTTTVTIPTYPYVPFLRDSYDTVRNIPYHFFDRAAYDGAHPAPVPTPYTLLVLENDYLRVALLPALGGRIYQITYKPTGNDELYQNPVLKPTHWGPFASHENWWMAAGGIEWGFPTDEHGYEWGEPWSYSTVSAADGVTVTVQDSTAPDRMRVAVDVHLPAGCACLRVSPHIVNGRASTLSYKFWSNATLAPGPANTVGPDLRFVVGADQVSIHSTGDTDLPCAWPNSPAGPDCLIDWPLYNGRDYSRLGNWRQWLGVFEYPQAQADFVAVYDDAAAEGIVRVFPAAEVTGSKIFALGWSEPIASVEWTDDGSYYVELHGGVAPTFWDRAWLAPGAEKSWTETWYPVAGIDGLVAATEEAALGARAEGDTLRVALHSTRPRPAGMDQIYAWRLSDCTLLARHRLPAVEPGHPFTFDLALGGLAPEALSLAYLDGDGRPLVALNERDCIPPGATVEPLPAYVTEADFSVRWQGSDTWSGVAGFDVQVRDGYAGSWNAWLSDTSAVSATFSGMHGHSYFFRARAHDAAGNAGAWGDAEWGQARTSVLLTPAPVLVTSSRLPVEAWVLPGGRVTQTLTLSNTGNLVASAVLTDSLPAGWQVLTGALSASAGAVPTLAGGRLLWQGDVPPGGEVQIRYALSPTDAVTLLAPYTDSVTIAGSVLGPEVRQAVLRVAQIVWLPAVWR